MLFVHAAKSLQSCPILCDPIDGSPPGSPVPGILQARTLEWVAISFSNAWNWKVKVKSLSPVRLLATPWTAAYQAPPSMGFSRQEYWSGVPLPSLSMIVKQDRWNRIISVHVAARAIVSLFSWSSNILRFFFLAHRGQLLHLSFSKDNKRCSPLAHLHIRVPVSPAQGEGETQQSQCPRGLLPRPQGPQDHPRPTWGSILSPSFLESGGSCIPQPLSCSPPAPRGSWACPIICAAFRQLKNWR